MSTERSMEKERGGELLPKLSGQMCTFTQVVSLEDSKSRNTILTS